MKSTNKIIILVFCAAILVGTILYFHFRDNGPKYRWNENYYYDNVQPYGLKLAADLISESCSKNNFILIDNPAHSYIAKEDTGSLYMFIGENFIGDSILSKKLMDFVHRGNNAFISSIGSEHYIFSHLTNDHFPMLNYDYINDSIVEANFDRLNPEKYYKFDYKNGPKKAKYKWLGLDTLFLRDSLAMYGFEPVSRIGNVIVETMRVKYGKGWFIFHSNPLFFTNYNLSKENGYHYLNQMLSEYRKPRILWDEFSKSALDNTNITSTQESPLRFILSEKSLRWAWYLIGGLILLFVIFNSKRKQAQIPITPSNTNTTVEFINSIATLYFKNNSNIYIAEEMMKQFLSFVKHKYGISPNLSKKDTPKILAPLSGISESELDKLFEAYGDVVYNSVYEPKSLIKLHSHIENFYKNCK